MQSTVYAMISCRSSDQYTKSAIDSFFKNTKLTSNDVFYLIDNDAVGTNARANITVIVNAQPQSFAKNINDIIKIAQGRDVVILNNDIEFTPGWSEPLKGYRNSILIPSCNQTHSYTSSDGALVLKDSMTLDEFANDTYRLNEIVRHHRSLVKGFYETVLMPFYAFRLPADVYNKVGLFNETFGPAGGEDVDYRIRAIQHGFSVKYVGQSYLLHFHGKSTWNGPEQEQEFKERNQFYFQRFTDVWGSDLANMLLIGGHMQPVVEKYQLYPFLQSKKITDMIKQLLFVREGNSIVSLEQVSADGLLEYVRKLGNNLIGCELGVCLGYTLRYFLDRSTEIKKVYAVDAYEPYMDHWGMVTQNLVDRWKTGAHALLDSYSNQIEWLELDSIKASEYIADNELDYIFIDGDHSYDAVSRDLRHYWSKVRPGGIFAGHDWNLPEVNRAVNDFRKEFDIDTEIHYTSKHVWFWYK